MLSRPWERDGFELIRRGCLAHLAPLAGRGRIASAMRSIVGAIRARGTIREAEGVESPPHPDPLPASGAREKWSRGFNLNSSCHSGSKAIPIPGSKVDVARSKKRTA